jgi:hypothetical protein
MRLVFAALAQLALIVVSGAHAAIVVETYTDRTAFEARLGGAVAVVDFDDVNTKKDPAAFGARRYKVPHGAIITGEGGQFASRSFGFPDEFIPTSAPNQYAPGPLGKALGEGGNTTDVTFTDELRFARVAGVGIVFIDADFPGDGASSLTVFDALGAPLGTTGTVSGGDGSQLFRGLVAVDANGNVPTAVITRATIVNGQGWPGVFDNEGVGLDDLVFGTPQPVPGLAGEICDNCVDDDGDGAVDRLDSECRPSAFAAGAGLDDPKGAGKRVDACQKGIEKAAGKFVAKKLRRLFKCLGALSKCAQLQGGPECVAKAQAGCTKQLDAIAGDETALQDVVGAACSAIGTSELTRAQGLGFSAEADNCADLGVPNVDSVANVALCIARDHECRVETVVGRLMPRAGEFLATLGRAGEFPCVPAGSNGGGQGLGGASGKTLLTCEQAMQKGALKFFQASSKVGKKCIDAAAKCVQEKPGETVCRDKVSASCIKNVAKLATANGTFAKLFNGILKKCEAANPLDLLNPIGLGFGAASVASHCNEIHVPLSGPTDLLSCLGNEVTCQTLHMFEREAPRGRELAELVEITLPERIE